MIKRVIAILPVMVFSLVGTAWGWGGKDHRMLVSDAIDHCPVELASFLMENLDIVMQGSVDPDSKFMDTLNHTYEIDDGTRNNPNHVAYLSSTLVSMMENRAPREKVAYWFGVLSHYVSDIDQPLHTSERHKAEWWYHPVFEGLNYGFELDTYILGVKIKTKLGRCLSDYTFQFDDTFDSIGDVKAWQIANARWAHSYYDEIQTLFTKRGAFDLRRLTEIYKTCINESGNDIVDIWGHICESTRVNWDQLPREEDVFFIDVDKNGRFQLDDERVNENELRMALEKYITRMTADVENGPPSVYIEFDDRCGEDVIAHTKRMCKDSEIEHISAILVRKGSWLSKLARAAKVHLGSLSR